MLLNTVHAKCTCFIFLSTWEQEASGSPLWALIMLVTKWVVVIKRCSPWVLFAFRTKEIDQGKPVVWPSPRTVRVFPSRTGHLWGKREKFIEKRVISTENIFLSLNFSICFSVKLEWFFFSKGSRKATIVFQHFINIKVYTKFSSVCSTLLLVFQVCH